MHSRTACPTSGTEPTRAGQNRYSALLAGTAHSALAERTQHADAGAGASSGLSKPQKPQP
jgi:hypothetical protein